MTGLGTDNIATGPDTDAPAEDAVPQAEPVTERDARQSADAHELRPGSRMRRLEMYNWGTYDGAVWTFPIDGTNALLTGAIGSGKSTIVDAITTLLMPAHRIAYNKASGADSAERSLRSYFLGTYSTTRSAEDGHARSVHLRSSGSYSVLLAVFGNDHAGTTTSLAQVFWLPEGEAGQPHRFYIVAAADLTVGNDFASFDGDIAVLKRRLRKAGHAVSDTFPEYGTTYRRALGIDSEQAITLFHQTVSMKSVVDLNDFVRSHMLEPLDMTGDIDKLITHFDDLSRAHEAVQEARAKIERLRPILDLCDEHDRLTDTVMTATCARSAVEAFRAEHTHAALLAESVLLTDQVAVATAEIDTQERCVTELAENVTVLERRRDGLGGDRLAQIDADTERLNLVKGQRHTDATRMADTLNAVGMPLVHSATDFAKRREDIATRKTQLDSRSHTLAEELAQVTVSAARNDEDAKKVNRELTSLRSRPSNIPAPWTDLRDELSAELGVTADELPFAGELMQIKDSERGWEGATERVLHGLGMSLLVPEDLYAAIAARVNARHLGLNLTYHRVPDRVVTDSVSVPAGAAPMWAKLDVKQGRFEAWMTRELARTAQHRCVDTIEELRREDYAVTKAGQIKGRSRHRKSDRYRIDDRSQYVLGWSNELKLAAYIEQGQQLSKEATVLRARRAALSQESGQRETMSRLLATIDYLTEFSQVDVAGCVRQLADLANERHQLESAIPELEHVAQELRGAKNQHRVERTKLDELIEQRGGLRTRLQQVNDAADGEARVLADPGHHSHQRWFGDIDAVLQGHSLDSAAACTAAARDAVAAFTKRIEQSAESQARLGRGIVRAMTQFRNDFPLETQELDASLEAVPEYRALHENLERDKLPEFEQRFKDLLNTNAIRDVATLNAKLSKEANLIGQRIDIINGSLGAIDYQAGVSYIEVVKTPTQAPDIRQFRDDMRACLEGTVGASSDDDIYTEDKFLQVKAIVERFKGRAGLIDTDRTWTRRVTDVRTWFEFSASERRRSDDTEIEHYTGSSGKSGGQKEKLAYTVLAAALAYQFGLDPEGDPAQGFRFIVIDEAFGRGDENSAHYALDLFVSLGLQVLVATPLQKIHVIEPFIAKVGFVNNPSQQASLLHTLTIEQYRAERDRYRQAARSGGHS